MMEISLFLTMHDVLTIGMANKELRTKTKQPVRVIAKRECLRNLLSKSSYLGTEEIFAGDNGFMQKSMIDSQVLLSEDQKVHWFNLFKKEIKERTAYWKQL